MRAVAAARLTMAVSSPHSRRRDLRKDNKGERRGGGTSSGQSMHANALVVKEREGGEGVGATERAQTQAEKTQNSWAQLTSYSMIESRKGSTLRRVRRGGSSAHDDARSVYQCATHRTIPPHSSRVKKRGGVGVNGCSSSKASKVAAVGLVTHDP